MVLKEGTIHRDVSKIASGVNYTSNHSALKITLT